jgi:hypothetical protein
MSLNYPQWRAGLCIAGVLGLMCVAPASAQQAGPPDTDAIEFAASIDFMNQYIFRGVRQNATGMAVWPAIDVGINVHSGDGALRQVRVGGAFLNSLHTGDTGRRGPTGDVWYESRLSGSVGLRFAGGASFDTTYSVFTSPNHLFTTVKEIAVKASLEDRQLFGAVALDPYALAAFEVQAGPGDGQLDGGLRAGKYLELGVAPRFTFGPIAVTIPVATGLSIGDYYELATDDHAFGFATVGGMISAPLHRSSALMSWRLRGGVQYHALGNTTKAFNGGDSSAVVASIGVALSR